MRMFYNGIEFEPRVSYEPAIVAIDSVSEAMTQYTQACQDACEMTMTLQAVVDRDLTRRCRALVYAAPDAVNAKMRMRFNTACRRLKVSRLPVKILLRR